MESEIQNVPVVYYAIDTATKEMSFTMPSDILTCSLLKTLAASKPNGRFLELGTGTGLSTAWILDGMDKNSSLISIDNDSSLLDIAKKYLGNDTRLNLDCIDGEAWVNDNLGQKFDYIFADTWHGKYLMLEEVLEMLNNGGLYIIDDMLPQENWPEGHAAKALNLEKYLKKRADLKLTKLHWATGIMIAAKV
jgi:predicted O-methyltransferase YrrM